MGESTLTLGLPANLEAWVRLEDGPVVRLVIRHDGMPEKLLIDFASEIFFGCARAACCPLRGMPGRHRTDPSVVEFWSAGLMPDVADEARSQAATLLSKLIASACELHGYVVKYEVIHDGQA